MVGEKKKSFTVKNILPPILYISKFQLFKYIEKSNVSIKLKFIYI
jgi:hypothetical protein